MPEVKILKIITGIAIPIHNVPQVVNFAIFLVRSFPNTCTFPFGLCRQKTVCVAKVTNCHPKHGVAQLSFHTTRDIAQKKPLGVRAKWTHVPTEGTTNREIFRDNGAENSCETRWGGMGRFFYCNVRM